MDSAEAATNELALTVLKRADALVLLSASPRTRSELMNELDVSRTTIHRTIRTLEDAELIEQDGDTFELTPLGRTIVDDVTTYQRSLIAANHLHPLLETLGDRAGELRTEFFADANIATMGPRNPYRPVERFIECLRESDTIRGFDTTSIAPIFVAEIREEILGGMTVDVVYLPSVIDDIMATYPDEVEKTVASGNLRLATHEGLPFGLAVFDDRVGIGGYDEETGMLCVYVDTDDPDAREWAIAEYERYRAEATPATDDLL